MARLVGVKTVARWRAVLFGGWYWRRYHRASVMQWHPGLAHRNCKYWRDKPYLPAHRGVFGWLRYVCAEQVPWIIHPTHHEFDVAHGKLNYWKRR